MDHIRTGIQKYQSGRSPELLELMRDLVANGQKPTATLVTCSDSRVLPEIITASTPGSVFIVRNVGNIVPVAVGGSDGEEPLTSDTSVGAAIEFSLEVLGVEHLIVMGHSDCGAMKAVKGAKATNLSHLDSWLENARPSLHRYLVEQHLHKGDEDLAHDAVSKLNVISQLENLASYPNVQSRLSSGKVTLHGWWYKIDEAELYEYDSSTRKFRPFAAQTV